jgi:hypothetical protein
MVEELARRARMLMAELERLVERLHLGGEERVEIPPFLLGSGT